MNEKHLIQTPFTPHSSFRIHHLLLLVGADGIEPPTFAL